VASLAEMPHADEALKSLVARFKEAPASPVFTELAAALLARGHAAEALRIAEHGLQLVPASVDGRIERAAALLALGRPRVAFVELKRALAINPTNRRAMRLLGKVFVDAGTPGKAAELLAQRLKSGDAKNETIEPDGEQNEPTHVTQSPYSAVADREPPPPLPARADTAPLPKRPVREDRDAAKKPAAKSDLELDKVPALSQGAAIPDLFSDLTRDLGLSGPEPMERAPSRVEVTQIIRRKPKDPRPRSASELAMIEGPIVDTTQPGQITEITGDFFSPQAASASEPPPLFDAVTSPRLQLTPFGLDDEPLFQEHMPFAVRPVESLDASSDLRETMDEEAPPELDAALKRALDDHPFPGGRFSDAGDTLVDQLEESSLPPERVTTSQPTAPLNATDAEPMPPESADLRLEGPNRPLLEIARPGRRLVANPKLELVIPKSKPTHVVLAFAGAALMIAYLAVLFFTAPSVWKSEGTAGGSESERPAQKNEQARSEP
jgi:hypothetical protein